MMPCDLSDLYVTEAHSGVESNVNAHQMQNESFQKGASKQSKHTLIRDHLRPKSCAVTNTCVKS